MRIPMLALVLLAGCAGDVADVDPEAEADPLSAESETTKEPSEDLTLVLCGADMVLDLVGSPLAEAEGRLPDDARMITPDALVTQDYLPKRMNVFVDEKNRISQITCG